MKYLISNDIMHRLFLLSLSLLLLTHSTEAQTELIVPGGDWYDSYGNLIVATEGGIIKVGELFYMWGMDRSANNYTFVGINLYSSSDLKNWTFINQILKSTSHPDLDNGAVVERAKLLHNASTGQFVIWMHFEGQNAYSTAEVGYATCNSIGGDYTFHSHFRPQGIDSRDINVYQDDDGKAYLICTTEGNQSVSLFELNESYTGIVREVFRGSASNDMECEGHAIIKSGGYYFWLMSWCTGWDFNDNHYFYAQSLEGPWLAGGKIAVSTTHTYESQVGFAVTVNGSDETTFLYTGDRWSVSNFSMSRIVLLPIEVTGTTLFARWHDQWNINTKTGRWSPGSKNFINGVYTITAKYSGLVLGTNGSAIQQQNYTGENNQLWRIENIGASHFKVTSIESGKVMDISGASRDAGAKLLQYDWSDSYNQKWHIIDCGNGYHRFVNINTLGKALEIENNSESAGTDAVLGVFAYEDNQLWRITAVNQDIISGQNYTIQNRASGKVIDAGNSGDANPITQSTLVNSSGQVWKIEDLFNGYYTITLADGSRALDNANQVENGSTLTCSDFNGKYAQQWQIVQVEGEYYKLFNRISGKVMDNKDNSTVDGNPIIQYTDYAASSTNQQWRFIPADIVTVDFTEPSLRTQPKKPDHITEATIYDLRGRAIKKNSSTVLSNKQSINLPNGVYIVKGPQNRSMKLRCILED